MPAKERVTRATIRLWLETVSSFKMVAYMFLADIGEFLREYTFASPTSRSYYSTVYGLWYACKVIPLAGNDAYTI